SNAGAALRALDVTDRVRGGTLRVRGSTSGAGPQAVIEGGVVMDDYTIVDAPALARILNAMSVTGLAELLSGEGISFGNLTGSFHKQGDKLRLWDMRTAGGALGLTLEGDINLAKDTARLNGTIVPVYGVNRILGQIPLLGDLLSGGPGQGLFAATWTVEGPLADPAVSVNPLALLTPGFLRNLFFGGGGGAPGERAPVIIPEMENQR
nr:AsmA-like C-terminal region-containing protein [Azospirillaceae bacterium]